jgi:hypothetical protein
LSGDYNFGSEIEAFFGQQEEDAFDVDNDSDESTEIKITKRQKGFNKDGTLRKERYYGVSHLNILLFFLKCIYYFWRNEKSFLIDSVLTSFFSVGNFDWKPLPQALRPKKKNIFGDHDDKSDDLM